MYNLEWNNIVETIIKLLPGLYWHHVKIDSGNELTSQSRQSIANDVHPVHWRMSDLKVKIARSYQRVIFESYTRQLLDELFAILQNICSKSRG